MDDYLQFKLSALAATDYPGEPQGGSDSANYQASSVYYRAEIENIKNLFITTLPSDIPIHEIRSFLVIIHTIFQWVCKFYNKDKLRTSLSNVIREITLALQEHNPTPGGKQTRKYYRCLENAREHLINALHHW